MVYVTIAAWGCKISMYRYFKIFLLLARDNFIRQTAYRPSFFLILIGKLLRVFLFVAFTDAICSNVPVLADWTHERVPLLILTLFILEFLTGITFHRNLLYWFPEWIYKGEYDYIVARPINNIFLTSFRMIDFYDLISLVGISAILIGYLIALAIPLSQLIGYSILLLAAYFILFAFTLTLASINFWTFIPTGIGRLYESIERLNRFPLDVLPKFWRVALFYVVPVAVAGNIPAKFLIGTWSWWQLLYIVVFAAVIFWLAVKIWYRALRHYSSVA